MLALRVLSLSLCFFNCVNGIYTQESDKTHPPCIFNPLCTCSKHVSDLGIVTCKNVPLTRIPHHLNVSIVYTLHLENNKLRYLEPNVLRATNLFRIEVSSNELTHVSPDAFAGLDRSLWQIDLHNNHLTAVPSRSIRYLQRLRLLDLSGNHISDISPENWRGVENSLTILSLRNNDIFILERDAFDPLKNLEVLDLSENALMEIGNDIFNRGPHKLHRLYLRDNALRDFPYNQLSYLKNLRHVDLSHNQISRMQSVSGESGGRLYSLALDSLHLEYNEISFLPPRAFDSFQIVNSTFLDGNPLEVINADTFSGTKIKEIYLRHCYLNDISPGYFNGLHNSLSVLDLEGNNLTSLPAQFFNDFKLQTLSLRDNFILTLPLQYMQGYQYTINKFDFGGSDNGISNIQDLTRIRNLRSLRLTRLIKTSLSSEDFKDFGIELEEVRINDGKLESIRSNAFQYVRGLKLLDLSDNFISNVDYKAFEDVGHSLLHLNLADGFSSSMTHVPHEAFRPLTSLRHLDLSNNKLKHLAEASFHSMRKIEVIHLDDNNIDSIIRGTFQGEVHSSLKIISMAFNSLSTINPYTFTDMQHLTLINLQDNKITNIEKKAFVAMDLLKSILLRGNKINRISEEAFENLPGLEMLDLAFNKLIDFDFTCLDQVGTLSSFKLNVSYNSLKYLKNNMSNFIYDRSQGVVHSNIEELDFSHNNISWIDRGYFLPIHSSLTHLHLGHNGLTNITKDIFGEEPPRDMPHLQWLDLSHNRLRDVDYDSFKFTSKIQILQMSHNFLHDLPSGLFVKLSNLRILDLSYNMFRTLPDFLFIERGLEEVVFNHNMLSRFPFSSFSSDAASSVVNLDFSYNNIVVLHSSNAFHIFESLQRLDLSGNHLASLDESAFALLPRLSILNISHNRDLSIDPRGQVFRGIEDTLEELYMKNITMRNLPEMRFPSLTTLDISSNRLVNIQHDLPQNMSSLNVLNLDDNLLEEVPKFLPSLTRLRVLTLSKNPIRLLNFPPGSRLRELDVRHLPLQSIAPGTFNRLPALQTLRLSPTKSDKISELVAENYVLEHLHLELNNTKSLPFNGEMRGFFSSKLRNVTISGKLFSSLPDNFLEAFSSPIFHMTLYNTSMEKLSRNMFLRSNKIRNLTLDVRSNNLKVLGNPNTGVQPNVARKMFLIDVKLEKNPWHCDCEIGWVEGWHRKRRQYICEEQSEHCREVPDDLRITQCNNKREHSLIEVLKYDIECGFNSGSNSKCGWFTWSVIVFIFGTFRFY